MFIFNAVLLHAMIVTAFEDGKPSWRYLSTATVTHSLLMALHHALDISLTRRSPFKVSAALRHYAQLCALPRNSAQFCAILRNSAQFF